MAFGAAVNLLTLFNNLFCLLKKFKGFFSEVQ